MGKGESTPNQPGDVLVTVKSIFIATYYTGLPRFHTDPSIYPKPKQLEYLRKETWEELSLELGAIGKEWAPFFAIIVGSPQLVIIFCAMYPFLIIDEREGHYRPQLWKSLGLAFGFALLFMHFRCVVSRWKTVARDANAIVSKFQAVVETEGYYLELLSS